MIQPPNDTSLITANQILVRLKVRRELIFATVAATFLAVAVLVLILPRAWTSSTDIYIDYRENDPISGMRFSAMLDDSYMRTQLEMIRSRVVTERVIERLGLRDTSEFREALDDGKGAAAFDGLVRQINQNTEITTSSNSRVLTVSYTADTPEHARAYADAIIAAYLQVTRDMAVSTATQRTDQYRTQLDQLRHDVEAAQTAVTQFQQETGLLTPLINVADADTRRLDEMLTHQLELQSQLNAALSRNQAWQLQIDAGARPQELPQVGQLPQMVEIQRRYTEAAQRLAEQRVELGPNHPRVREARAEVEQLLAQQSVEAQAILDAQRTEALALDTQLQGLDFEIARQREFVLSRMTQRDQLASLQRQLESANQIYRAALSNYDTLVLAGTITPHNVSVLRPASLPSSPSRPKILQSLLASLFVGLFLGVCLALLLELLQLRLRCLDDLLRTIPQPTLGRIGLPDSRIVSRP